MISKYHVEITKKALRFYFSEEALETVINANIRQDQIKYQFGHDYIHFDGSAFLEGFNYIDTLNKTILASVNNNAPLQARIALGRLLHSWQDFYSHSNYIPLWLNEHPTALPEQVDFDDIAIFHHQKLKSGKNYGIVEFLAMIPGLSALIKPLMPEDSHARMNMDSYKASNHFEYVYFAALKRSKSLMEELLTLLENDSINQVKIESFLGKPILEVKV